MGIGEYIVIGLSVVLLLWFFIGSYQNNEKIQKGFRFIQKALKPYSMLGSAVRLDPSSIGAKFIEVNPDSPFQKMDVILSLMRRDNPPLFLFQLFRKRTDMLIFKAALSKVREGEIHLVLATDVEVIKSIQAGEKKPLVFRQDIGAFKLFSRGREDQALIDRVVRLAKQHPGALNRISFLTEAPHIVVIFRLPASGNFTQETFDLLIKSTLQTLE